jgi:quercetin dioxygenase-like cupin family protein
MSQTTPATPLDPPQIVRLAEAVVPPADGIISRTIYQDDRLKVVLFGFGAGQELSEHTASKPAVMHFLSGQADVKLGEKAVTATAGTWIHMAAGQLHAISAQAPTVMLLWLFK